MGDYASKGVAGSGLGLGIAGTALGLLNGNGLGGLLGGNNSSLQAEIAQLKAEKYTNDKLGETYIALNNQINKVAGDLATLSLNNERRIAGLEGQVSCLAQATNTAIAGINNTLGTITKTVVPIGAICPEPMPATTTTTPTTGA